MKDLNDWAAVHSLYKHNHSIRKTATELHMSRNTVRRLLKMSVSPQYARSLQSSILDEFKELIIEFRCVPYEFNGTRIFRELKSRGYKGSIATLYRFLRKVDEDSLTRINPKATVRHESPPGDQAQFDWSEFEAIVNNRQVKVYCFAMILACSRKKAVCFSLKEDAVAIYEAIQELYEDFGGVTLELLIDNPKALVLEHSPKSEAEIRYNPHALLLARHMGFELNACPCYWPRKKGKIERPFNIIYQQFVKGMKFASMEDLNRRGKAFVNEWCNQVHTTTKRIPNVAYYTEEKPLLQELPKTRFWAETLKKRKVSADCMVSIDSNKYSVPAKYATKDIYYRLVYGYKLEFYDDKQRFILATEACDSRNSIKFNPEHVREIAPRTPTSIPQIRRDFCSLFTNGSRYLEVAEIRLDQPTHHARLIMALGDLYERELLDTMIGYAIERNALDIASFKALLFEYNSKRLMLPYNKAQQRDSEYPARPSTTQESTYNEATTRECNYYETIYRR